MNKTNDGGPAFPDIVLRVSLRDYFAAAALQGLSSLEDNRPCPEERRHDVEVWRREVLRRDAAYCYEAADAMLAEREKTPE
jgi:hypothetical protein